MLPPSHIRNFAIISHIDHGKSTLADRLMEETGLLPRIAKPKSPRIDRMELEIERGVTIKLKAVRLPYTLNARPYTLNMIDTPGHADFSYEVSRSLAACEGVLLLVDATQGSQAQTIAHLEKARSLGLIVIGVINKIDSPLARVDEVEEEMRALGIKGEILKISALKGEGIGGVLQAVVGRIPSPKGSETDPFRALVFDSTYDEHLGVIAYARVVDGSLTVRSPARPAGGSIRPLVRFLGTGVDAKVKEIGVFTPDRQRTDELSVGEVGYIATGLKDPQAVRVGDTVIASPQLPNYPITRLPGYKEPQSFVFASFFPAGASAGKTRPRGNPSGSNSKTRRVKESAGFAELKEALSKLRLEEPAVSVEEIASPAFGRGFKLGFLGTFHMEIVKERLEREFDLELVVTKPTVRFQGIGGDREHPAKSEAFRRARQTAQAVGGEPWIRATIITPSEYLSGVIKLVENSRGDVGETTDFGSRLKILTELPLMEFVKNFYDRLKSLSSGYASLDWEFIGYRPANLVRLDIAVHGEVAEGLSEIVLKEQAQRIGREKVKKLKEVMPRQQFSYALQAMVGSKILAREDVPAMRKDVTAPLYGGDITRKRKLLKKQKKGKKRLAAVGRVKVPPEAFLV